MLPLYIISFSFAKKKDVIPIGAIEGVCFYLHLVKKKKLLFAEKLLYLPAGRQARSRSRTCLL